MHTIYLYAYGLINYASPPVYFQLVLFSELTLIFYHLYKIELSKNLHDFHARGSHPVAEFIRRQSDP